MNNASKKNQPHGITKHAWRRMTARRISGAALEAVMSYGRIAHVRSAKVYAIGRKEVERHQRDGVDLSSFEGIHVVCSLDGAIMTTYRNHNFRGLRPRRRRNYRQAA
jgi:hypothetical protein